MIKEYFREKQIEKYKIMLGKVLTILFISGFLGIIIGLPGLAMYHVIKQNEERINKPNLTYNIAIIRPDGTIHDQYKLKSRCIPYIDVYDGQAFLYSALNGDERSYKTHIPNGWKVEVSPPEVEL